MAETIIFDMDGTLVDTMLMTALAFEELAESYDLPVPPRKAIKDAMGLADLYFYRKIYPNEPEDKLPAFGDAVEKRESAIGFELGEKVLFEGVKGMLEALKANGKRLYLASTGSRKHVRDMLTCGGILELFEEIHCAQPDKEEMTAGILRSAGTMDAVFVGDTFKDANAACANDIPAIGAGFGYVKDEERALFDCVLDTPEALLKYLLSE